MADTREHPDEQRRDDAYLVDDVRVCPFAGNSTESPCWWVVSGRPNPDHEGAACRCLPPPELWGRGR